MNIELCTQEELEQFAEICTWLRAKGLRMHCRDTCRRKPKEVKIDLIRKSDRKLIATA